MPLASARQNPVAITMMAVVPKRKEPRNERTAQETKKIAALTKLLWGGAADLTKPRWFKKADSKWGFFLVGVYYLGNYLETVVK